MIKADRGFGDREKRYGGHTGDRSGLRPEDIRRKIAKGWADKLSLEHREYARRQGWL